MDHLLLLRRPITPTYSQRRPSPLTGSIHFVVEAERRKRRRRITGPAVTKALRLAISLTSSFRGLFPMKQTSLDRFLLHGGGAGGRPPIWTGGAGGRWWSRPGSGASRSKTIPALLALLALASAISRAGRRSPEMDAGFTALVPVILGLRIASCRRWIGLAILGLSLYALALRRSAGKRCGRR